MEITLDGNPCIGDGVFYAPNGRYIVAHFKINGQTRKFILAHGEWDDTIEEFIYIFDLFLRETYTVCPTVVLQALYDPAYSGWNETQSYTLKLEPEVRALIHSIFPNYEGQIRVIDGRRYRLEAV